MTIQIISENRAKIGQVAVTFTIGRIKPKPFPLGEYEPKTDHPEELNT